MTITDQQVLTAAQRKHRRNCEAIAEQCTRLLRGDPTNPAAADWQLGIARRNEDWDDVPEHMREMMLKEIREIVEDAVEPTLHAANGMPYKTVITGA